MNNREEWRERESGISVLVARHDDDDDDEEMISSIAIEYFIILFSINHFTEHF